MNKMFTFGFSNLFIWNGRYSNPKTFSPYSKSLEIIIVRSLPLRRFTFCKKVIFFLRFCHMNENLMSKFRM